MGFVSLGFSKKYYSNDINIDFIILCYAYQYTMYVVMANLNYILNLYSNVIYISIFTIHKIYKKKNNISFR